MRDVKLSSRRCIHSYKYKSIHSFDKSHVCILYIFVFIYLYIVFVLISSYYFASEVIFYFV